MMAESKHSRRLAWGLVFAVATWSLAQLVAAIAPNGLL